MASQNPCKTPFDIVDEVRQHLQQAPANDSNWHALVAGFRKKIEREIRPSIDGPDDGTLAPLTGTLGMFGGLFFGRGKLDGVEIVWKSSGDMRKLFGLSQKNDDGSVTIWVNPEPFSVDPSGAESDLFGASKTDSTLSTMAHEAIHALLTLNKCPCGRQQCDKTWKKQVGTGDHGAAFCRIAALIQKAVRGHNLWHIDFDFASLVEKHLRDDPGNYLDPETVVMFPTN